MKNENAITAILSVVILLFGIVLGSVYQKSQDKPSLAYTQSQEKALQGYKTLFLEYQQLVHETMLLDPDSVSLYREEYKKMIDKIERLDYSTQWHEDGTYGTK